jgi:N-acetylglucosaminyldiphosphoundecaprenol N-acetyl-beta-D-mannosaminyltransferase
VTYAERVPGPDLMLEVVRRDVDSRLRHFLFGSTDEVLDRLATGLRQRFPGVQIAETLSPGPATERDPEVLDEIRAAEPHVVWTALGAPKQELWAHDHAAVLAPSLLVCVGAAFDFHAGTKRRAPEWMREHGLEWLHRLGSEPRRLGWRYLSTNSLFVARTLRDLGR